MTRRTIPLIILAAGLACALAVAIFRVPVRVFASQPQESAVEVDQDATIKALVRRAQIDYYIFPIHRLGHRLVFLHAARVPPNDVYLVFSVSDIGDVTVRYRCSLEDHRLLWKAAYSE